MNFFIPLAQSAQFALCAKHDTYIGIHIFGPFLRFSSLQAMDQFTNYQWPFADLALVAMDTGKSWIVYRKWQSVRPRQSCAGRVDVKMALSLYQEPRPASLTQTGSFGSLVATTWCSIVFPVRAPYFIPTLLYMQTPTKISCCYRPALVRSSRAIIFLSLKLFSYYKTHSMHSRNRGWSALHCEISKRAVLLYSDPGNPHGKGPMVLEVDDIERSFPDINELVCVLTEEPGADEAGAEPGAICSALKKNLWSDDAMDFLHATIDS